MANRRMDPLEVLLNDIGRRRRPDVALWVTCSDVFDMAIPVLDPLSIDALVAAAWQAMSDAGTYPREVPLPDIMGWVEAGLSYDDVLSKLNDETFAKLALVGLITPATERFVNGDGGT